MTENERLRLDYEQTGAMFRALTDIRFRLLALIPALTGAGLVILSGSAPRIRLAGGLLGGTATFGVIIYDLRNTHLYDAMQQRLRALDALIGFSETRAKAKTKIGGNYLRRPRRCLRYFGVRVAHDYGLGIIYSAAIGGWAWLAADAFVGVLHAAPSALPTIVAILVFVASYLQYWWNDRKLIPIRELPETITQLSDNRA